MCVYIYIYVYLYVCIYLNACVYIYMYVSRCAFLHLFSGAASLMQETVIRYEEYWDVYDNKYLYITYFFLLTETF